MKDKTKMFIGVKHESDDYTGLTGFTISPLKSKIICGIFMAGIVAVGTVIGKGLSLDKFIEHKISKSVEKHAECYVTQKESK